MKYTTFIVQDSTYDGLSKNISNKVNNLYAEDKLADYNISITMFPNQGGFIQSYFALIGYWEK